MRIFFALNSSLSKNFWGGDFFICYLFQVWQCPNARRGMCIRVIFFLTATRANAGSSSKSALFGSSLFWVQRKDMCANTSFLCTSVAFYLVKFLLRHLLNNQLQCFVSACICFVMVHYFSRLIEYLRFDSPPKMQAIFWAKSLSIGNALFILGEMCVGPNLESVRT